MRKTILGFTTLFISSICLHIYFLVTKLPLTPRGTDATTQMLFYRYLLTDEYRDLNFFWSWSYGLGGDLFAQFNYYYSASIFFLFSTLFDVGTIEDVVALNLPLSIAKVLFAMFFMFLLLQYEKRSFTASMIGGLLYGGAATFAIYNFIFDFMVDAFVWLPLLILSFHHYLKTKRPLFFILTFAFIVASNFYFAFIATVYFMIYAVYKYTELHEPKSIRHFGVYTLRLAACYTASIGIAAFSFLPAVYQFLSSDRLAKDYDIPLAFAETFYEKVPQLFFMSYDSTYTIGMAVLTFVLLVCGWSLRNKELLPKKIFVLIVMCFYLIPFMYSLFNGLSAMQNRWYYLIAFTCSFMAGYFFDEVVERKKIWIPAILSLVALTGYMLWRWPHRPEASVDFDRQLLLLGTVGVAGIIIYALAQKKWRPLASALIIVSLVWTGSVQYYAYYSKMNEDVTEGQQQFHDFFDTVGYGHYEGLQVSNKIKQLEEEFGRTIWDSPRMQYNSGMYYGLKTHSAYHSLIPRNIHQLYKEKYNVRQTSTVSLYHNYDNRLYLETALGNEFYVSEAKTWYEPYGYESVYTTTNWHVRRNENKLPVGFAYPADAWMSEETFESLSTPEKDQAILSAVTVKDGELQQTPSTFDRNQLEVETLFMGMDKARLVNMEQLDGQTYVVEEEGYIEIPYRKTGTTGELIVELDIKPTTDKDFTISIQDKAMLQYADKWTWSYPKETFTINLGWQYEKPTIQINLTPGTYEIGDVRVYRNSYEPLKERTEMLAQQGLENVSYSRNQLSGNVTIREDGIFFLSIPYSRGWTVKVDGQKQDIYEVNHAFIGFPISPGDHNIEMTYISPFFKEGVVISILTLLSVIFYAWRRRKADGK
ncbi:MAG: YfhO family protein [Lysinibacillus sp.]